ncbi:unnamed protein product [Auanema sp. JU1783]|nr:unnamed protein product [Auanema sp. JU1783]
MKLFLLLLALCTIALANTVAKRVVAVKGTLVCGGKPAANVKVRLFRVKQTKSDDLNQILDESLTGPSGMFEVEGNTNGFPLNETDITPTVSFYHSCDEDAAKVTKNGYRKFDYNVPYDYVTLGQKAKKTFDIGTMNLQVLFPGEKHDKKFVERNAPKKQ